MSQGNHQPDLASRMKLVLRYLPAPVGIVTSYDPASGAPIGLAMSAIMPMALEPCSMAIAVNRSGSAHEGILATGKFCINLLDSELHGHMGPFASAELRDLRFTQPEWKQLDKVWYLEGAPANIFCDVREKVSYGTHDLLIGEVYELVASGRDDILGWANGALGRLAPLG